MKDYRRPTHLRSLPKRIAAYTLYRERDCTEPTWSRPTDFKNHSLPRPIVLVNGAFDLLHRTHMRLLFAARHKAATLVVALDADEKVAREKGEERPILNFLERLSTLSFMPVDTVVEIKNERDMKTLVTNLAPDLRVQGEDYATQPSRFPAIKKLIVREGNLRTSTIISRILDKYAQN